MIKQLTSQPIPDGAVKVVVIGDESEIYFADDPEVIAELFNRAKIEKQIETLNKYNKDESKLLVNKNDYRDMMSALIVDVGHGGKTPAETRKEFKAAVIARQEIQNSRDSFINKVIAATTIEELDAIDVSGNI